MATTKKWVDDITGDVVEITIPMTNKIVKPIIKCSNWDADNPDTFGFLSYVYLHGDAERLNGFDCCEGNIETFKNIFKMCISCATMVLKDKTEYDVLIIPAFEDRRIKGLICLCDDLSSVKDAVEDYFKYVDTSMYEHDKEFLLSTYPVTYGYITNYRHVSK